jgi:hypothetical protein
MQQCRTSFGTQPELVPLFNRLRYRHAAKGAADGNDG